MMNFRLGLLILISISIFSVFGLAEISGTVNTTESNTSGIVTGVYGSTYAVFCTADNYATICASGDRCAVDWDGVSNSTASATGWCALSGSSCANHSTDTAIAPEWHAEGYAFCNDTWAVTCSGGAWSSTNCNATGQNCTAGSCSDNATSTDGTSSTDTSSSDDDDDDTETSSMTITSGVADFEIIQGGSIIKKITVKNNGEIALSDVEITITGIETSWFSISKKKFSSVSVGSSITYIINFTIPADGEVKSHSVTASIIASDGAATTDSFIMKVTPSSETIEAIEPLYQEYLLLLDELEQNLTHLENAGANSTKVEEIRALINSAKEKLNQTNTSIEGGDYFTASTLLDEALTLLTDITTKSDELRAEVGGADLTLIIITAVIVLLIIGGILAYLFLPDQYLPAIITSRRFGFKPRYKHEPSHKKPSIKSKKTPEKLSKIKDSILNIKKKKREKKGKFRYEFKR